jgi:hypothetical protein
MASPSEQSPGPGGLDSGSALRLAEHLQTLAQLGETLTYRLLELEERLAEQQLRLGPLLQEGQNPSPAGQELGRRLEETETRLQRMEELLAGMNRSAAHRRLQSVHAPRGANPPADGQVDGEGDLAEEPFAEEGEQPFMDEQSA